MNRAIFAIVTLIGIGMGCGPMNQEKKTDSSNPVIGIQDSTSQSKISSKNNTFLVYTSLQSSNGSATTSAEVGDNVYLIRCVHADNLSGVSEQMKIDVTYEMPEMPDMGTDTAAAIRQSDGTYLVSLFFGMSGLWHMTVKLQDGSSQDEYVFETKI
ncbi:FixH family protein [Bdellovibrionota bacterium FG-2]